MITFIVPTIWKSDYIHRTVESLLECKEVGLEMIIIDNANSDYISPDPKIKVLKQEQNIFVNPAWNLGVNSAKNQLVCIINDDITLNVSRVVEAMKMVQNQDFGMIGLFKRNLFIKDEGKLSLKEIDRMPFFFGSMMILDKKNYIQIPDSLKIFYGDNYLYSYNVLRGKKIYWLDGLSVEGETSVTSKNYSVEAEENIYNIELEKLKQSLSI